MVLVWVRWLFLKKSYGLYFRKLYFYLNFFHPRRAKTLQSRHPYFFPFLKYRYEKKGPAKSLLKNNQTKKKLKNSVRPPLCLVGTEDGSHYNRFRGSLCPRASLPPSSASLSPESTPMNTTLPCACVCVCHLWSTGAFHDKSVSQPKAAGERGIFFAEAQRGV